MASLTSNSGSVSSPLIFRIKPLAPSSARSTSGLSMACWTASITLPFRLSPIPNKASLEPLCRKIETTSAKSTFTTPVTRMTSEMQRIACRKILSASLKDCISVMRLLPGRLIRLSLCTTKSASICSRIASTPCSATRSFRFPSKENGTVTTPMESMPNFFTSRAMTGAAPVPTPPPMPAVMNTRSTSFKTCSSRAISFSAAFSPISATPPVPRPFVKRSPICKTSIPASFSSESCFASVLTPNNSMPGILSSASLSRTLFPPPPTPTTLIRMTALVIPADKVSIG